MSIRIYHPKELPFGLLSNNFEYKMLIDGETWDNVTQYIYTNLIPSDNQYLREKIKSFPYDIIPKMYVEYETQIKDEFIKDILTSSLEKRFLNNDEAKEYLLKTGRSNLYYINHNNLYFGTIEEYIPMLKSNNYSQSKNILGLVFEKIRDKLFHLKVDSDYFKQYINYKKLKDMTLKSYEQVIEILNILNVPDENKHFSDFLPTNDVDVSYTEFKEDITNDPTLLKILIISEDYPFALVAYTFHKNIRNTMKKLKEEVSKVVFNKYLDYFEKTNSYKSSKKELEKELKYFKIDFLQSLLFDLYQNNKLPSELLRDINLQINNVKIMKNSELKQYDNFDITLYETHITNEETLLYYKMTSSSKKDFIFTDSDTFLSIFTPESVFLENRVYDNVHMFIQEKINENDSFNQEKRIKNIENLIKKSLDVKFGINFNNRHSLDLQHLLYFLKNIHIIHLDDTPFISEVTSEYLNSFKKDITIESIESNYENSDVISFIEKDLFMNTWLKNYIEGIINLSLNIHEFIKNKYNEDITFDSSFLKKILPTLYEKSSDNIQPIETTNNLFNIIDDISIVNIEDDEKNKIKEFLWGFILTDLQTIWNDVSNKDSDTKNVLYNIQLNLSSDLPSQKVLDNNLENLIFISSLYLFDVINNLGKQMLKTSYIYDNNFKEFQSLNIEYKDIKNLDTLILKIKEFPDSETAKNIMYFIQEEIFNKAKIVKPDFDCVYGVILNSIHHILDKRRFHKDEEIRKTQELEFVDTYPYTIMNQYDEYDEEENYFAQEMAIIESQYNNDVEEQHKNVDDDDDDDSKQKEKDEIYDNDFNNEYDQIINKEVENDEQYDDDYLDGSGNNIFHDNKIKNQIIDFLSNRQTKVNVSTSDIIRLIYFIKNDSIIPEITINRCNFFQKIHKKIIPTKRKQNIILEKPKFVYTDDCNEIASKVYRINGIKGGSTVSETWLLETKDEKKIYCKIFVNSSNNEILKYANEQNKEHFTLSAKSLEYEKRVYKEIIDPMIKLKICKHFIPLITIYDSCKYQNLLSIVKNNVKHETENRTLTDEEVEHSLKRNINNTIIFNKNLLINNPLKQECINYDNIESLTFSIILTKFFDNTKTTTFTQFLQKYSSNVEFVLNVLFQIAVVCFAFSLNKMTHNDLHADNIFIKQYENIQHFIYYINDVKYEIDSFFKVYVFDFNFSFVENIGKNEGINNYLCDNFNVCNFFVPNKDILKIICAVSKFLPFSVKYTSSKEELRNEIFEIYNIDNQCFFRPKGQMGPSVTQDFFNKFDDPLTILKSIYYDIPKRENVVAGKIHEQNIKPVYDGNLFNIDSNNISVIHQNNFIDGKLSIDNHINTLSSTFNDGKTIQDKNDNEPIEENINEPIKESDNEPIKENDNEPIEENINEPIKENGNEPINSEDLLPKEEFIEKKKEIIKNQKEAEIISNINISNIEDKDFIKLIENGYLIFYGDEKIKLDKFFNEQFEFKNNKRRKILSNLNVKYSHPSSFHHTELRTIRSLIHKQLSPLFKKFFKNKFQMLIDCFYDIDIHKYSFDVNELFPKKNDSDILLRGWINLNTKKEQTFSYKKINDNNIHTQNVFPRQVVLYNVDKIKEVEIVNKDSGSSHRLYFGFYFPNDNSSNYFNDIEKTFMNLETPSIMTNEVPILYNQQQLNNWESRVKWFYDNIHDSFLDNSTNEKYPSVLKGIKDANESNKDIIFIPYSNDDLLPYSLY
jgi:predicted NAD-dependent protein-ADP-ribosyltransferase YbiA (DUF1768 family)